MNWNLSYESRYSGDIPITSYLHEIRDINLDDRLYYGSIGFDNTTSNTVQEKIKTAGFKIIGVKADGTEVIL